MDDIILVGSCGHASSCIDVIELSREFKIAGFVDKASKDVFNLNLPYPILGIDDDLEKLRHKFSYALIAVGQIKTPNIRIGLFRLLKELDYKLPRIISPKAYVSKSAQIGEGTVVFHDAMVNADAKIGQNCIINSKVLVEHDAIVGDHCHISTGAILNGNVVIGNESFIGTGVVTSDSVSIGNNCVIGAGVVLKKSIESNQVIK